MSEIKDNPAPGPSLDQPGAPAGGPVRVELHLPSTTIIKVLIALLACYVVVLMWPLLLLVFLAMFLAVTLHAFVEWLTGRGLGRRWSLSLVVGGFLLSLGASMALLLPALVEQAASFSTNLPRYREEALSQLPAGGELRAYAEHLLDSGTGLEVNAWLGHFVSAGGIALSGLSQFVLLLVIALYLVMDGGKTFEWVLAFFSPLNRRKLRLTSEEVSKVIFGYVSGQVVTSLIVMVYTYCVLQLLHVPAALMLAIIAGVFDILPIIGFFAAAAPAVLLALGVSTRTAVTVLGLYILFHAVETYLIIPRVYGKNLRLSTLTVLLGLLAGALLAGVAGALAALPVIASYSAVERLWLRPFLRGGVAEKHELQKDEAFGEKE